MTRRIRGGALSLMIATCALGGAGCKKDTQSLVVAQLKLAVADSRAADLMSVSLTAMPGPTRSFQLTQALSVDATIDFGMYLPGNITGNVTILAVATPASGCVGFRGSGNVQIASAGTIESVVIALTVDDVCADGGGGGSGGSGAGGSGGSGGGTGGSAGGATAGTGGATAGTGGTTTGGAGGAAAGRGGGAGTTAGTGGSAGSGGRGGGAGGGGRGGSAGSSGGTGGSTGGTGGMAGYPSINSCRSFPHGAATGCPNVTVRAIAVSANGQMVASVGNDYRLKIWTFDGRTLSATGKEWTANAHFSSAAFSPDSTRLVFTDGPIVRTFTVSGWVEGTPLAGDGGGDDRMGVAFTPDGKYVISADDKGNTGGNVYVHDITGNGLPMVMKNVPSEPWSLAASPRAASDGSVGIAVGTYYSSLAVLKLTSGILTDPMMLMTRRQDPMFATPVNSVCFSADGTRIAEGEDSGAVRWWAYPITSTTPIGDSITFAGGNTINAIAFSPSGTYLAVGGTFATPQLSIYSVATQAELARATPAPAKNIQSLAFSPSGGALIAGEDDCGTILVCN